MSETYKFYIQMEGEIYGPYSAKAVKELDLPDDILVTEESMNGQWLPASRFDFDDMVHKEGGIATSALTPHSPHLVPTGGVISQEGTVTSYTGWQPQQSVISQSSTQTNMDDNPSPFGWCILAFFAPLVGWILYFCWRSTKPRKASAVCTWAWIGFAVGVVGNMLLMSAGL